MISFPKPDVELFFRTFHIQQFAVSRDEKQLVFSTNLNGKYDLWAMDLPHLFPYPITFQGQNCGGIHMDPQGRFLLAAFDQDGNENWQIYALPRQGGQLKPIRVNTEHKFYLEHVSADGERIYYLANHENARYLNIYRYHLKDEKEELLVEGKDAPLVRLCVSEDETKLAFLKAFANTSILAYVKTGEETICLTSEEDTEHVVHDVVFYSDDHLLLATNYGEDFSYLAQFHIKEKKLTPLLTMKKEEIRGIYYQPGCDGIYLKTCKGVQDFLYHYDLKTQALTKIPTPVSIIQQIIYTSTGTVYIAGHSSTRPANIYRKKKDQYHWEALTNYRVPGIAEEALVEPEVLTYPSYDGLEIEALFFRAHPEISNKHVILWPHGGPQHAERKQFRALFQFLLHRGYSIFAPNFRGSTGYGHSFCKMVERDWGHGPRLDNITGVEWLIQNGYADRDKLLLMGGSYGGYMALLLAGRHADYFKAVVDIFGVSNLFSFIESVPEDWKPIMKRWVGDPVEDREKLIEDSPITYVKQMTKPILIIQGANDPRVVKNESDQIVAKLRERGVKVEYLVLEDEGHGFSKKENEIQVYRSILQFFDQFIS
ncbi:S9 family peptidase [Thermoflavimicrobium dichotomicum]|uniref:Dipeptidyl aminopeptidase/acylaminoacyl peptidase n=1 Tax=Thermoflavimicrobium dichotomicum TaxID=46223 RepID=A0A1I3MHU6_9BACL|nr:S9 family peptidase [Thermoflavimicrobium dichotomicum]SFI96597.1 Dipeptidyl aminopeptidase/acylaminoacyl peptidase [Thermoflavimicrobium dichotomicum]